MSRWLLFAERSALSAALILVGVAASGCGNDGSSSATGEGAASTSTTGAASSGGSSGSTSSTGMMAGAGGQGGASGQGGAGGIGGAGGQGGQGGNGAMAMPDFTLIDVNPNSPTFNQEISPSQFSGQVSAWYFGHST